MGEKGISPQPEPTTSELTQAEIKIAKKVNQAVETQLEGYLGKHSDASAKKMASKREEYEREIAEEHGISLEVFKKYKESQKLKENTKEENNIPKENIQQDSERTKEIEQNFKNLDNDKNLSLDTGDNVYYQKKKWKIYGFAFWPNRGKDGEVQYYMNNLDLTDDKEPNTDFHREEKLNVDPPKYQIGEEFKIGKSSSRIINYYYNYATGNRQLECMYILKDIDKEKDGEWYEWMSSQGTLDVSEKLPKQDKVPPDLDVPDVEEIKPVNGIIDQDKPENEKVPEFDIPEVGNTKEDSTTEKYPEFDIPELDNEKNEKSEQKFKIGEQVKVEMKDGLESGWIVDKYDPTNDMYELVYKDKKIRPGFIMKLESDIKPDDGKDLEKLPPEFVIPEIDEDSKKSPEVSESIPVIELEKPKEPTDEEIENAIKLTEQKEKESLEAKAKERFEALNKYLLESEENIKKDIEGRGRLNKILQTYKRNSGTRMVLGGALAVISAINPGAEAYQAFRVLFSGLGGYIAGENYAIGKTEKAALNLLPKDENGEVDLEKIKELDKDTLKEVYAALEQTASVKGLKINRELYKDDLKDHEERMNKKSLFGLNKKFNNLKEKYANLSAKKKIGLAVLTLGLGVATVPTLAMAGVGTSVGIGVSSGIQLFMGMLRTDIERNGQAYKHSEIIEEIRTILANNQDFEAKDIYDIYERRKEINKGRKKLAIGGGALMAIVSGVIMGWKLHQEQTKIEHTEVEGGNQPSVKGVIPISENQTRLSPEEHLKEVQAGSTNLKAELEGIKPETLKMSGTSEHLAKAVVDGLEGKGQLPKMSEMDKENLIRQINAKWEHDGISGSDGLINNFEILKQTSPIGTVHDVLGNMNAHGNNYYTDLLHVAPENIQNTNGAGTVIPESQFDSPIAKPQIPNPTESYSTSGGGKSEYLINNRPTAASGTEIRNPFSSILDRVFDRTTPSNLYAWDHAKVMNKEQLASFLNPNNKNIIPEFSKQIDELVKNGMKPENVRISEDGKHLVLNLQGISSDPDRQIVVHQLVNKKSLLDPLLSLFHRTRPEELERYTGSKAFLGAENQINTHPNMPAGGSSINPEPRHPTGIVHQNDGPQPNPTQPPANPVEQNPALRPSEINPENGDKFIDGNTVVEIQNQVDQVKGIHDVPRNVLDQLTKNHPDWTDGQKYLSYKKALELQLMDEAAKKQ